MHDPDAPAEPSSTPQVAAIALCNAVTRLVGGDLTRVPRLRCVDGCLGEARAAESRHLVTPGATGIAVVIPIGRQVQWLGAVAPRADLESRSRATLPNEAPGRHM